MSEEHIRHSHDRFISRMEEIHPDITVLNKYKKMHDYILCECKKCGAQWEATGNNLVNNFTGCPSCNISKGERLILNELKKYGIKFLQQFYFDDCKDKKVLPFDFAVLNNDNHVVGLIEYDGEQHYVPVKFFGGIKSFSTVMYHDELKNSYAVKNNIPLLRCNYKESHDEIINNILIFLNMIYK